MDETGIVDANGPGAVGAADQGDAASGSLDPELMEVGNEKYHEKVALVLPLSSGRFASLTPDRRLYQIVGTLAEAVALAPAAWEAGRQTRKREAPTAKILVSNDLLEELGL